MLRMDLVLLFIFILVMYFVVRPFYYAWSFTRPLRFRVQFFTPTSMGVEYVDVQLRSKDGTRLEGWYLKSRNGAAVILLHGHSSSRLMMSFYAERLVRAGYGVLMFDLRAHGNSDGRRFARSQHEVDDVLAAVTWLSKNSEINAAGIGVVGVSMGGMLALQATAQTVAIRAVWADGASPANFADYYPPYSLYSRYQLLLERYYWWAMRWLSRRPSLPPNITILPKIAPRPVHFVSTGKHAEQRLVRRYFEHTTEPKTLWEIPEARHAEGCHKRREEYGRKLVTFFDQNLVRTNNSSRVVLPDVEREDV